MLTIFQLWATESYSQLQSLPLKLEDAKISDVLKMIENQSEFFFLYSPKLIDVERKVNIDAKNETIKDILTDIFDGEVKFAVYDRQVILTSNEQSGVISALQQKKITGTITDEKGNPLPGVTVLVKGTKLGTLTDAAGKYEIKDAPQNATLTFSFVGMTTQEIQSNGRMLIDVVLKEQEIGLNEVVVVGYGTQKKVSVTGSVVEVKNDIIKDIPVANISSTLAGRLPGIVAVQQSGEPGQDVANISIRGFGNPLILVDGVERDFNQIDPNEIESITVLKDASAAIYGSRAGNGVILVTTKRGETGKPLINFSVNSGFQSNTRMPSFVNAGEYAQSFNDAMVNSGNPAPFSDFQIRAYKYVSGDKSVKFTDAEQAQFESEKADFVNTDWLNVIFKPAAPIQQYNLSSSGGNDNIKYFISLGYLNQQSILRSNDDNFKKYSFRSNIDAKITKDLSISLDLAGRLEETLYPGYPIASIWNCLMNDVPTIVLNPNPLYPTGLGEAASQAQVSGTRTNNTKDLSGSISLNYSVPFVKGLSAKARFDYWENIGFEKDFLQGYEIYSYDPINEVYTPYTSGMTGITNLTETNTESNSLISRLTVDYDRVFGKNAVKGLLIGEYISNYSNTFDAYRTNYLSNALPELFAGSSTGINNDGSESADGRISYAGRFNYAYSSKYLLETTFRFDASPRFAPAYRWGFFPSILAGWRLSEENFIKNNLKFVNNLKFRLSYGKAGVDNIASYNYIGGYNYSGGFVDNANMQSGIIAKGLANVAATWEKHTTYNAGLDFDLWNSKLYGSFDAFYKERTGILATRAESLPSTFGATLPSENLNSMNYRGFELQLGHKDKIGEIEYNIDGNIAWNRAKNGYIEEPDYSSADVWTRLRYQQSGQWADRYFGLQAVGLFKSQAEINAWPVIQDGDNNLTLRPGDIKYLDYNGDGKITDLDYHPIGKSNTPELTYGLNIGAKWKGFDLNMLWQGAADYGVVLPTQKPYPYNPSTMFSFMLDYWSPDNINAKYPRIGVSGFTNNQYPSTFWLIAAYYVRLKDIQLGYTLPPQLLSKIGVSRCRFYISAVNLLTVSNVTHFDPETVSSASASNYSFFPQQKTISIGANISF